MQKSYEAIKVDLKEAIESKNWEDAKRLIDALESLDGKSTEPNWYPWFSYYPYYSPYRITVSGSSTDDNNFEIGGLHGA